MGMRKRALASTSDRSKASQVLFGCVSACLLAMVSAQNLCTLQPSMDMFGLINLLYYKADSNRDGVITEAELEDIYHGLDMNGDDIVTTAEFVPLWREITQMNQEMSSAFFYLADLDDNGQIDSVDLRPVYLRFDLDGDGSVSAQEFNLKWQQLYNEAPFAVLFMRADTNKDDALDHSEYPRLFSSFSTQADGSVTNAQFEQGWCASGFGTTAEAESVFNALDTNSDLTLDTSEVNRMFNQDDVNNNNRIEMLELVEYMFALIPTPSP